MNDYKTVIKKLSKEYMVEELGSSDIRVAGVNVSMADFVCSEAKKSSLINTISFSLTRNVPDDSSSEMCVYNIDEIKKYIEVMK